MLSKGEVGCSEQLGGLHTLGYSCSIYIHPMAETANLTKAEMDLLPDKIKTIIGSKIAQ